MTKLGLDIFDIFALPYQVACECMPEVVKPDFGQVSGLQGRLVSIS